MVKIQETQFAERLKAVRNRLGLTQEEMSTKFGLGKRMYALYEKGEYEASGIKLTKLTRILDDLEKGGASVVSEKQYEYGRKNTDEKQNNLMFKMIPFYDINVAASNIETFTDNPEIPDSYITAPGFEECDFACPVYGHSAYPTYENGVIVACKRIKDLDIIAYGEYHLVITAEQRLLKRILKGLHKGHILAISDNPEKDLEGRRIYDSFEIPIDKIRFLYLVKGCVKRNQI